MGILGDSRRGKYFKNKKERWYYELFKNRLEQYLGEHIQMPVKEQSSESNYSIVDSFSVQDRKCFDRIMAAKIKTETLFYVGLSLSESEELFAAYGNDRIVAVTETASDILAEDSGKLGLVAYYDVSKPERLIRFRLRRGSKYNSLDLRDALKKLNIDDGGGLSGAVGFRIPREKIDDFGKFLAGLTKDLDALVKAAP
jgi:hypothetical protein